MKKKLFGLLFIVPLLLSAQFTIKGKLTPSDNFSWLLLYKIIDGKQIYLDNTEIKDSNFEFVLPESENSGVYRVFYQLENQLYVELIYNREPIDFFFDPYDPVNSIEFINSSVLSMLHLYRLIINAAMTKHALFCAFSLLTKTL